MVSQKIKLSLHVENNLTFPLLMAHRKTLRLTLKIKGFIK